MVMLFAAVGLLSWRVLAQPASAHTRSQSRGKVAAGHKGAGHAKAAAKPTTTTTKPSPPPPFKVTSVSPRNGSTGVGGETPITVSFSTPVALSGRLPSVSPSVPGSWVRDGARTLAFRPGGAYVPDSKVTVTIPTGVRARDGAQLAHPVVDHFSVTHGSVVRLQQLLSLLDYSPLAWRPSGTPLSPTDTAAQLRAAFHPPAGNFYWRQKGWPSNLTSLWHPGTYNVMVKGLVMSFEADHALTVDGIAGPHVWATLLSALANHQLNTGGYNYALASETQPESLTIWHNGKVVFHSPANTGIAASPTAPGTFPVYERLRSQVMRGTNPNGSHYADPVQNVAYFNGGDAVHYIARADYGIPQSLGCVELPLKAAAKAWPWLAYGTLVTVTPPA